MRCVLVAVSVAAVLAGCGGGSRLSKDEYVKRADEICSRYNAKIRGLGRPASVKELPSYVERALPVARKGNDELRVLKPPEDEEKTAREWLEQNEGVVAAMGRLRDAAKREDRPAIQVALAEGSAANRAADLLARRLGLKVCARG